MTPLDPVDARKHLAGLAQANASAFARCRPYVRTILGDTPYEIAALDTWNDVLDSKRPAVDAILVMAETGMAWESQSGLAKFCQTD